MKISNRDELVHNLANLIAENEYLLLRYQIDIYAYLDQETGIVTLDEFPNPGGSSALNDDHYTIYRVSETYDDPIDFYVHVSDVAEALGMTYDSLLAAASEALDQSAEETTERDMKDYAEENYADEIEKAFRDWYVTEFAEQFREKAEEAVAEYESEYVNLLEDEKMADYKIYDHGSNVDFYGEADEYDQYKHVSIVKSEFDQIFHPSEHVYDSKEEAIADIEDTVMEVLLSVFSHITPDDVRGFIGEMEDRVATAWDWHEEDR